MYLRDLERGSVGKIGGWIERVPYGWKDGRDRKQFLKMNTFKLEEIQIIPFCMRE